VMNGKLARVLIDLDAIALDQRSAALTGGLAAPIVRNETSAAV